MTFVTESGGVLTCPAFLAPGVIGERPLGWWVSSAAGGILRASCTADSNAVAPRCNDWASSQSGPELLAAIGTNPGSDTHREAAH